MTEAHARSCSVVVIVILADSSIACPKHALALDPVRRPREPDPVRSGECLPPGWLIRATGRGGVRRSRTRLRLGDRNRPLLWGDDGRQAFAPDSCAPEGKHVRALRSFVLGTRCGTRRMRGGLHGRREVGVDWRVADAPDKVVPSGKERVACLSPAFCLPFGSRSWRGTRATKPYDRGKWGWCEQA